MTRSIPADYDQNKIIILKTKTKNDTIEGELNQVTYFLAYLKHFKRTGKGYAMVYSPTWERVAKSVNSMFQRSLALCPPTKTLYLRFLAGEWRKLTRPRVTSSARSEERRWDKNLSTDEGITASQSEFDYLSNELVNN